MKEFNPIEWLTPQPTNNSNPASPLPLGGGREEAPTEAVTDTLEHICTLVEEHKTDLTADYLDWVRIGAAMAHEGGEAARSYFHRISRFYPGYDPQKTDQKFDNLLRSPSPNPASLGSIIYMAEQAGLQLRLKQSAPKLEVPQTTGEWNASFDISPIKPLLPPFLQEILDQEAEDIQPTQLIGSLVFLSSVLPRYFMLYDGIRAYPNLFGFVVAPPASNKGKLNDIIHLVQPIDQQIRLENKESMARYDLLLAEYRAQHSMGPAPIQPPYKSLIISGNSTDTAIYKSLADNGGVALTFESEGDVIARAFQSDYGNYSTGLRAAFHHEPITYTRRKDAEHVEIKNPRWSVLLSGTPMQVTRLLHDAENGLASRFLYLCLPKAPEWHDTFQKRVSMAAYYENLGQKILQLHNTLNSRERSLQFQFSDAQEQVFTETFRQLSDEYLGLYGDQMVATVRRMGLICSRIAMVLSMLRFVDTLDQIPARQLTCKEDDFLAALQLAQLLLPHTARVYCNLLEDPKELRPLPKMTTSELKFYITLPDTFSAEQAIQIGTKLKISKATVKRYLGKYISKYNLLTHNFRKPYIKINNTQEQ